jgi:hypothetical protein
MNIKYYNCSSLFYLLMHREEVGYISVDYNRLPIAIDGNHGKHTTKIVIKVVRAHGNDLSPLSGCRKQNIYVRG